MTEPSRRETTLGCAIDEAQFAARRALVVQFRAGSKPVQRRLLGRVEHVLWGQATTFSPSTSCPPSSGASSPRSMTGGRTGRGPQRHANLQARIPEHPDPQPVEAQARRGAMSPRNVLRVFVRKVGMTSERFVERGRVEVARRLPEEASRGVPDLSTARDVSTARGYRSRAPP